MRYTLECDFKRTRRAINDACDLNWFGPGILWVVVGWLVPLTIMCVNSNWSYPKMTPVAWIAWSVYAAPIIVFCGFWMVVGLIGLTRWLARLSPIRVIDQKPAQLEQKRRYLAKLKELEEQYEKGNL